MELSHKKILQDFSRQKDFLICIDSDGCAMDTMTVKHSRCFAPCLIESFNLQKHESEVLQRWNAVNLYSPKRGINRFKGAAVLLKEFHDSYGYFSAQTKEIDDYIRWVNGTSKCCNEVLEAFYESSHNQIAKTVLEWSYSVNKAIANLTLEDKMPFAGVAQALKTASSLVDIAVVSSANSVAVLSEWQNAGFLDYVAVVLTQEAGSKSECINTLIEHGYVKKNVIMLGDAPSDLSAAEKTGVLFYPILATKEVESWAAFNSHFYAKFINGSYDNTVQQAQIKAMEANLSREQGV